LWVEAHGARAHVHGHVHVCVYDLAIAYSAARPGKALPRHGISVALRRWAGRAFIWQVSAWCGCPGRRQRGGDSGSGWARPVTRPVVRMTHHVPSRTMSHVCDVRAHSRGGAGRTRPYSFSTAGHSATRERPAEGTHRTSVFASRFGEPFGGGAASPTVGRRPLGKVGSTKDATELPY